MTQGDLRKYATRLFQCKDISACRDMIDIYNEFFLSAIQHHQLDPVNSVADAEAKLLLQMVMTKLLYLKNIIEGVAFTSRTGVHLNPIIDPTVVASHSRSIFEMVGLFNLIYRSTSKIDEKIILYNLWAHAGLAYRQRFTDVITTNENSEKAREEKERMQELVEEIKATELFNQLSEQGRIKIDRMLKERNFLIKFDDTTVRLLHWHHLIEIMHIKAGYLDHLYTYYSLYAHPSNVAVFQFGDLFHPGHEYFTQLSNFSLNCVFILVSCFIADYVHLFPAVLHTYNSLPLLDQIAINFHNKLLRGMEFSINDSWKALG